MKKITLVLTAALFFTAYGKLYAHPPGDVRIELKDKVKVLMVEVSHGVREPEKHFVKEIEVYVNGELQTKQNYSRQYDVMTQHAMYLMLGLKKGDEVTVKAKCNLSGEITKKIVIDDKIITDNDRDIPAKGMK
ncbi:MAG: hypothetical protein JXJ19_10280 [Elusimicrobia bacterium]|nr:hypothetical protein [Elusimicrobiota bacterium]